MGDSLGLHLLAMDRYVLGQKKPSQVFRICFVRPLLLAIITLPDLA